MPLPAVVGRSSQNYVWRQTPHSGLMDPYHGNSYQNLDYLRGDLRDSESYGYHSSSSGSGHGHDDCCPLVFDPLTLFALLAFIGAATAFFNTLITMNIMGRKKRSSPDAVNPVEKLKDLVSAGRTETVILAPSVGPLAALTTTS